MNLIELYLQRQENIIPLSKIRDWNCHYDIEYHYPFSQHADNLFRTRSKKQIRSVYIYLQNIDENEFKRISASKLIKGITLKKEHMILTIIEGHIGEIRLEEINKVSSSLNIYNCSIVIHCDKISIPEIKTPALNTQPNKHNRSEQTKWITTADTESQNIIIPLTSGGIR